MNRVWRLRNRPVGVIKESDLELVTEELPVISEGQMLVKNEFISVDPTHRIWMSDKPQYMPCVNLGDVMRACTVGTVEASNNGDFPVGCRVVGFGGCGDYYLGIPGATVLYPASSDGAADLSVFSIIIGLTAWHGVNKILEPKAGDIVVVSGAAGAVGSLVGQLAKNKGATVIGIAGSDAKCAWLKNELGFDLVINYKTQDVEREIAAFAPDGITGYFDNVGGAVTDAVLMNCRNNAKVAMCGSISEYNDTWTGQKNWNMILMRRITVQGFICVDHMAEFAECVADLRALVAEGKLKYLEDIRQGLETYIQTVNTFFSGENSGKLIIKV